MPSSYIYVRYGGPSHIYGEGKHLPTLWLQVELSHSNHCYSVVSSNNTKTVQGGLHCQDKSSEDGNDVYFWPHWWRFGVFLGRLKL